MNGSSFHKPSAMLDALVGKRIPGGCSDCGSYQEVVEAEPNVYLVEVRHDSSCPTFRAIAAKRGGA